MVDVNFKLHRRICNPNQGFLKNVWFKIKFILSSLPCMIWKSSIDDFEKDRFKERLFLTCMHPYNVLHTHFHLPEILDFDNLVYWNDKYVQFYINILDLFSCEGDCFICIIFSELCFVGNEFTIIIRYIGIEFLSFLWKLDDIIQNALLRRQYSRYAKQWGQQVNYKCYRE